MWRLNAMRLTATNFHLRSMRKMRYTLLGIFGIAFIYMSVQVYKITALNAKYSQMFGAVSHAQCYMPDIHHFDASAMRYYKKYDEPDCHKNKWDYDLIYLDSSGRIAVNVTMKSRLVGGASIYDVCKYKIIERMDDMTVKYSNPLPLKPGQDVPSDFFLVECSIDGNVVFSRVLYQIYPKRHDNRSRNRGSNLKPRYNVLIYGIDSTSRLNAMRSFPKTYSFMKDVLHAVDLKRYNQLGTGTYQNIVAVLTGRNVEGEDINGKADASKFPLLWHNFSKNGYRTLFSEDVPTRISLFNYHEHHFEQSPTDHYMRPFWLSVEKEHPYISFWIYILIALETKQLKAVPSGLCYGNQRNGAIMAAFVRELFQRYPRDVPKFSFTFLTSPGHGSSNYVQILDGDMHRMLESLHNSGSLDDTMVILLSDHGHRDDKLTMSFIGQIEKRTPFAIISLPKKLRETPEVFNKVKSNADKLTNPFDLFETLHDVLLGTFTDATRAKRARRHGAFSLFETIPSNRTCRSAGISEGNCACFSPQSVSVDDSVVQSAAQFAVSGFNLRTLNDRSVCHELKLNSVLRASVLRTSSYLIQIDHRRMSLHKPSEDVFEFYNVTLSSVPGNTVFTCIVRHDIISNTFSLQTILNIDTGTLTTSKCKNSIKELEPWCTC